MGLPTVCFSNNKGGVGKTTCSSLFAEYLALIQHKRVLLIDFDGQLNLTSAWVGTEHDAQNNKREPLHPEYDASNPEDIELYNPRSAITDIYFGKEVLPHNTYITPADPDDDAAPRVDIIAGSRDGMIQLLSNFQTEDARDDTIPHVVMGISNKKIISRLAEFCGNDALAEYYDVIIIDSGPTETPLHFAAIHASTHVVIPYKPDEFSFMGISTQINNIKNANLARIGRFEPIQFIGLLPNLVERRMNYHMHNLDKTIQEFQSDHMPEGFLLINSQKILLRQNKTLQTPQSIFSLKPSDDVRRLADNVFSKVYQEVFHGQA